MDIYTLTGLFLCFILFLYVYGKWESGIFRRKGVKNLPFDFLFVGNLYKLLRRQEHLTELVHKIYHAYTNEKYMGILFFGQKVIMMKDLDILKSVTIKNFEHFHDRQSFIDTECDPLLGNNLFFLNGRKWRDMRAAMSPTFTSMKMKNVFDFVSLCGQQMIQHFTDQIKNPEYSNKGYIELEMRDTFTRYTANVFASTAFGIELDSFKNKEHSLYKKGLEAANFSGVQQFKIILMQMFPKILKALGISIISKETNEYFRDLVMNVIKDREERNIIRHDIIDLLMKAKTGNLKYESSENEMTDAGFATVEESQIGKREVVKDWTDYEIVAQIAFFFIGSFDTPNSLLSFLTHELAINDAIQKRLQSEIDLLASENKGKLKYSELAQLKYLDMVVSETLRKWPPAVNLDRRCTKDFVLPPPNDDSNIEYKIKKNETIWIPIYAIHRDPKYYPNPDIFDPERFSDENKSKIEPLSYIPFGIGPRNCIGSRFALMMVKAVIFHLLLNFNIKAIDKTQNPIELSKSSFNLQCDEGFWLGLQHRNKDF